MPGGAGAQPQDGAGDVVIDVTKPNRTKYPIAIPMATAGDKKTAKEIHSVANFDMSVAGWFRVLDSAGLPGSLKSEGTSIDPSAWKGVGAFGVVKYRSVVSSNRVTITFKLYEIEKGSQPVLQKTYKGKKDRRSSFHPCVLQRDGQALHRRGWLLWIEKSHSHPRDVDLQNRSKAMDFDGHKSYSVSRNRYVNILPSFSPSGGKIAYTSYMRDNTPISTVASAGGGRPKRISKRYGMNTGAAWSPDGSQIALDAEQRWQP